MKSTRILFGLIALFASPIAFGDETFEGKVIKVIDGDTITVTDKKEVEYEVQLEGIDAPELKQDFGKESTQSLTKLLKGK